MVEYVTCILLIIRCGTSRASLYLGESPANAGDSYFQFLGNLHKNEIEILCNLYIATIPKSWYYNSVKRGWRIPLHDVVIITSEIGGTDRVGTDEQRQ